MAMPVCYCFDRILLDDDGAKRDPQERRGERAIY